MLVRPGSLVHLSRGRRRRTVAAAASDHRTFDSRSCLRFEWAFKTTYITLDVTDLNLRASWSPRMNETAASTDLYVNEANWITGRVPATKSLGHPFYRILDWSTTVCSMVCRWHHQRLLQRRRSPR